MAVRLFGTAAGLGLAFYLIGLGLRPDVPTQPRVHAPEAVAEADRLRDVHFDPDGLPAVQVAVDYEAGTTGAWYPKGESSILGALVREGKLPSVAERVGPEPLVMEGVDGIGKYGGTWHRVATAPGDVFIIGYRLSGAMLVRWSPLGYPIRPHLAKGWSASDDKRVWTVHLRRGVRWSDGHPFTADDILYWWEHEAKYLESAPPTWMTVRGKTGEIVKVDTYTVKFVFPEPNGVLLESLATNRTRTPYAPRHYLEQYHPELGKADLIEAAMAARGVTTPRALYKTLRDYRNPEHPRMWPWVYRTYRPNPPEGFVRNPYFWAVDAEGNQLPYVDRILFEVKNTKLIPLAAASGDITMQARHITFDNYTLLMENRARHDYQVYHWFPAVRSSWTLFPNMNRRVLESEPATRWKAQLLADKRFRQALSIAIHRQEIIEALYGGQLEPAQIDPGRGSEFHNEALMHSYTEHDPQRAGALLDELGLTERDFEGMRTFPDGTRMTWYIDFTAFTGEGPAQFIVDDWAEVGVRALHRERARPLYSTQKNALLHDFSVWAGESEFNPLVEPRSFVPTYSESHHAPAYGTWFQKGGLYGNPLALQGGIEPPVGGVIRRTMELLDQATAAPTRDAQIELFGKITDIAAEQVWSISIASPPPQLVVVRNGFRNVPRVAIAGNTYSTPANAGIETYYFDEPTDSPGAIDQIKQEMTTVTPLPEAVDVQTLEVAEGGRLGGVIRWLIGGIGGLVIILAAVRHPYIGRRLLIMVPTLAIISAVTFFIIQMPPGDYIETRILELRQTGDEAAVDEVRQLGEQFHLDESLPRQYVRWLGLRWFVTFDAGDRGLLQGHMGRSMETQREVNDIIGDRVLLTVLVSLGTILFTWIVALPVGIYSAVRQYTIGDYALSFIGFIGMCVPNFLLAILLMYWSGRYLGINVTGLFSPAYAAAPEWTFGKVMDLLQHIWVPVIVIGVGGTAGMIRVMRGNLLDELRKPYVITAMAKGVRPFRLLIKYPVRIALNPFISGIGAIFPQLVSGGAIVAIVLGLPMVGPVLLQGLMTEDVYLAASMLMVLSLLGVLGTLVSDLLLLWLDPRIRMEGGAR